MKLTELHVSDEHLNIMIEWMERTQKYHVLDALLELKQRRAEDRQREANRLLSENRLKQDHMRSLNWWFDMLLINILTRLPWFMFSSRVVDKIIEKRGL